MSRLIKNVLYRKFIRSLKWRTYNLRIAIRNLKFFIPKILGLNGFDYYDLDKMNIYMLEFLSRDIKSSRLQTAKTLLERVHDDYYQLESNKYYGIDYSVDPVTNRLVFGEQFDNLGPYFDKYLNTYRQAVKKLGGTGRALDRSLIAFYMVEMLETKARRVAYRIISQDGQDWWT